MKKLIVLVASLITLLVAAAAIAAEPLRIGALFAVTGPASFLGEPEKNTLEMLVKEANAKGGVAGRKLELVVYDTQGDVTKSVQLANKLIKNDKVSVIVGPSTTGESMAVIPLAEKEKIPLVSCAAGIKITEPVKKWVFKTPANDHVAVEKILIHAARYKQKNLAIITVSDGFGSSGREQLKALASNKGFRVVADEVYGPKDTDMTAQLTKIKASKPDAIICWGTNPGPAIIARNVKQLGIKTPLYMSHGVASKKFIELAGSDAAEGILLPAGKLTVFDKLPKNDLQLKLLRSYDQAYKKNYGVEASTFGGYAYDAFILISNALKKGGTPAQIRDGIEQSKRVVSVSGIFTMSPTDHNGLDLSAFEMVRITRGDWELVK
ncbi:ABC transporter substrate-binding protein [Geobacter hydrogenophilus]|uniref:Branched-chain amino acid ABC transporter substrate-binding protein n=1 Tax=Geobacter hydrogenophilus TaxID=40983 RepID=A0A9W6G287_9BACT|nr:ABC transporter substrate-binding protein [Geobacter hydrogenophilus]MBT0893126.1 ABC transporter substrate-binding protein [Geobacter hydrogenophilus]GLI39032.1 branched-chain amino acid ABC transporter substrate-binding protein [Geobacter hydrogenophilus]